MRPLQAAAATAATMTVAAAAGYALEHWPNATITALSAWAVYASFRSASSPPGKSASDLSAAPVAGADGLARCLPATSAR